MVPILVLDNHSDQAEQNLSYLSLPHFDLLVFIGLFGSTARRGSSDIDAEESSKHFTSKAETT